MAQDETPGSAPNGSADAAAGVQLIINAQYTKDLSFENPRAPQSLVQQKAAPEVSLEVDVKARNLAPELYEVLLTTSAEAKVDGEPVFIAQLTYAGVVTIKNAGTDDVLNAMIFIETPRLLFPFARNIIATATRDGGFPPLLINPIDFVALHRRQAQAKPASGATLNA
jgi:preprotein translocase subunit SecB